MDFQAYNKILICPDEIEQTYAEDVTTGYQFRIKYPSYRGTFLSCIEELKFWMDEEEIPSKDISFCLNGKEFLISELPECFKEYWYVRTAAIIRVNRIGGLSEGAHSIRVYMKHRIPYTGYFGEYLVLVSDVTEKRLLQDHSHFNSHIS